MSLRLVPPLTREQHEQQRALVEASRYRSEKRQERRDEAASYARIYPLAARRVQAVTVDPPRRPAA